ncbi:MAG: hypothetical protein AB1611_16915 [bacterium]
MALTEAKFVLSEGLLKYAANYYQLRRYPQYGVAALDCGGTTPLSLALLCQDMLCARKAASYAGSPCGIRTPK